MLGQGHPTPRAKMSNFPSPRAYGILRPAVTRLSKSPLHPGQPPFPPTPCPDPADDYVAHTWYSSSFLIRGRKRIRLGPCEIFQHHQRVPLMLPRRSTVASSDAQMCQIAKVPLFTPLFPYHCFGPLLPSLQPEAQLEPSGS